jgi:hypothetical protein
MPTPTEPPPARTDGRASQVESWDQEPAGDEKDRRVRSGLIAALNCVIFSVVPGDGVGSAIGPAIIVGLMTAALTF